jgi:HB1/ASXL restriction endonuclease-like protein with HTH domain
MTYLEAALKVLRGSKRPLTSREVTDASIRRGLIVPVGKTPEATMTAALYTASQHRGDLTKVSEPGPTRARRGTVRWTVTGSHR